jgi:uncharacterized membrane protein YjjB (DUF3815 family)
MLLINMLLAMVATLGFAVLFNAPPRVLWLCGVTGGAAFVARVVLVELGASANLATLLAAMLVGLIGELGARVFRVPALVFRVTGFIPLLPGALAYRTVLEILDGNYLQGLVNGLRTGLLAGAIAGGIGVVTALFRLRSEARQR